MLWIPVLAPAALCSTAHSIGRQSKKESRLMAFLLAPELHVTDCGRITARSVNDPNLVQNRVGEV